MTIAVFGAGYVGLSTAIGMAMRGQQVLCLEIDLQRLALLCRGLCPLVDDELSTGLREVHGNGNLSFASPDTSGLQDCEIAMICVGTPTKDDGKADLSMVIEATEQVIKSGPDQCTIVLKSTVLPGTISYLQKRTQEIAKDKNILWASNPEFLREGTAIKDFLEPERILIGGDKQATGTLKKLYQNMTPDAPIIETSATSAELAKYACNAFLATKIAFMGEIARLAELSPGTDIEEIIACMGADSRIGNKYLEPRNGFGGPCLPKDLTALTASIPVPATSPLLSSVLASNEVHKKALVERLGCLSGGLHGKRIAVWGLSFKPGIHDTRASPSVEIVAMLLSAGAQVKVWDEDLSASGQTHIEIAGQDLSVASDALTVLEQADALLVMTPNATNATLEPSALTSRMRKPVVLDCYRRIPKEDWENAGVSVYALGRAPFE